MEYTIRHQGDPPSLAAVRQLLADQGVILQTRMIDGQLAFPDEEPAAPWQELRVAINKNMITLRRDPAAIHVLTWGNADDAMQNVWRQLVWAIARVTSSPIETPAGLLTADQFLPPAQ